MTPIIIIHTKPNTVTTIFYALKSGILVGSIGDNNIFNFYAFFGGGMLYTFPFEVKESQFSVLLL